MTIREIADFTGKDIRTVRRWISKAGDKLSQVPYDKMSQGIAHNYTIEEVEDILNASTLSKDAVSVLMLNARQPSQDSRIDRLEAMVEKLCLAVAEIPQTVRALAQNNVEQIEFKQDYYSIKGYASKLGQQIAFSEAVSFGKEASRLSKEKCFEIRKVEDERFGFVNSYHVEILDEVFSL